MASMIYNVKYRYTVYLQFSVDLQFSVEERMSMKEKGRAYFVYWPRRLDDLMGIHLARAERPFEIHRQVSLSAIDYENFTSDLKADRWFLEKFIDNKWDADVFWCIYVHQRGKNDGLLIVPAPDGHVRYAAYWTKQR